MDLQQLKNNLVAGQFICLHGYQNSQGEVAKVVLQTGTDYSRARAKDVRTLREASLPDLVNSEFDLDILKIARAELLDGLLNPRPSRSRMEHLGQGIQLHPDTRDLYILGRVSHKYVEVEGQYSSPNSRLKTLAKKYLKQVLNLRTAKYRLYNLSSSDAVKIGGVIF